MNNFNQNEPDDRNGRYAGSLVPTDRSGAVAVRNPYGSVGPYQPGPGEPAESMGLSLVELWRIFVKRKWLILGIVMAAVSLTAIRTLMETPLYTASARIQIDRTAAKIVNVEGVMPGETMGW